MTSEAIGEAGYIPTAEAAALTKLLFGHLARIEAGVISRLAARIAAGEDPVAARDKEVTRGLVELATVHNHFLDHLHHPRRPS